MVSRGKWTTETYHRHTHTHTHHNFCKMTPSCILSDFLYLLSPKKYFKDLHSYKKIVASKVVKKQTLSSFVNTVYRVGMISLINWVTYF